MTLLLAWMALGCTYDEETNPHLPGFADISSTADGYVDLVDRDAALEGAVEQTEGGEPIDIAGATDFFRVDIDADDLMSLADALDTTPSSYDNLNIGMEVLANVDLELASRLGSHGTALSTMDNVTLKEWEDWLWSGEQAITNDVGDTVTARFNVHWVGTGWLMEMLQTSSDGIYDDTMWFNGYYAADGSLGWWDFRRAGGIYAVLEYVGDVGGGEAKVYFATTDQAGDEFDYTWTAPKVGDVVFSDEQPPPNAPLPWSASFAADRSGMATMPDYQEIITVCWDSKLQNAACPDEGGDGGADDTGDTGT